MPCAVLFRREYLRSKRVGKESLGLTLVRVNYNFAYAMILDDILLKLAIANLLRYVVLVNEPYAGYEKQHNGIHPVKTEFNPAAFAFRFIV